jgi:tetratricopeptide (TPR) repeat protein
VWRDNETLGRSMLATAPGSHIAHDILAQWYVTRGEFAAAKPHAEAALAKLDYADMRFLQGEIAAGEKRFEDAVRSYRRALELDATHTGAYNQLALLLIDLNRPEEARAALLAMQSACPTVPAGWLNLVLLYSQYAQPELALAVALDAATRFPDSAEVLRTAAATHLALGHASEAGEFTRRAAEAGGP